MYLQRVYIENNGPISQLNLALSFSPDSHPKPLVLVGGNGSGKTNLLSIIADSLFEAAVHHYTDAVANATVGNRPYFRILGAATIARGSQGSCAILEFEHETASFFYKEKAGLLVAADVASRVPESLKGCVQWQDDGNLKEFGIDAQQAKVAFESGVYVYFASSRAEEPHWLNKSSLPAEDFDLTPRFDKQLRKPIYVETGLRHLQQWLLGVLIDARMDVRMIPTEGGEIVPVGVGDRALAEEHQAVWNSMNQILRLVLDDERARFAWAGRGAGKNLVFERGSGVNLPIAALSAGQAILLNVFGTLLRYGEGTVAVTAVPGEISGICIVDEIDAHMHVDLQHRALPALISMFPKVQFLLSSHSPLFVLGMEKAFGAAGSNLVDMPSGVPIQAEAYSEFAHALDVLRDTQSFNKAVLEAAGAASSKLLVLLEGETDPTYMVAAAELLGYTDLLGEVEFEWVGAKNKISGQGFHTGKDALNGTANLLRAKPDLVKRPVLLLFDNDVNRAAEDFGNAHVRTLPTNPANTSVESGIENLLREGAISDDMFDRKETKKRQGGSTITILLNKMKLCRRLCQETRDPVDFEGFALALDLVKEVSVRGKA